MVKEINKDSLLQATKKAIRVITQLEIRVKQFRKEWLFYQKQIQDTDTLKLTTNKKKNFQVLLRSALTRLDHELMFLCIDTFSMYAGLTKKSSLFSKYISAFGKQIFSVDKTPISQDSLIFVGEDNWDEESQKDFFGEFQKLILGKKKEQRNSQGFNPNSQQKSGDTLALWKDNLVESCIIRQLESYRQTFAHRLDDFAKLDIEANLPSPDNIQERIDCVSTVLTQSKQKLTKLILHLNSEQYLELRGLYYDSLSRLSLLKEIEFREHIEKEREYRKRLSNKEADDAT